jgi:sugar phosphate isomerase/epimerase
MGIIPGLMSYSYHHSFPEGKMTAQRLIERVTELKLWSLEWCHFPCHESGKVDWNQVKQLDKLGREKGIKNSIAGFAPLLSEGEKREYMLDCVQTQLEVTKFIGAKRMRFHGMTEIDLGIGVQAPLEICLDNLIRVVELGEKNDIVIALENHMDFSIVDFRYFFDHIDSSYFKINLDTGNFLPIQEDIIQFANEFSEKIVSCHFKGVNYVWRDFGAVLTSCKPAMSLIDLDDILDILAKSDQEIYTHVEVVAMDSEKEDILVEVYADYLNNYINC